MTYSKMRAWGAPRNNNFRIEQDLACYGVLEIVGIARRIFHCVDQDLPLLHATAITDPEAMSLEDAFGRPRRAATWKH